MAVTLLRASGPHIGSRQRGNAREKREGRRERWGGRWSRAAGITRAPGSSVDQHFLRDLRGPVGWTYSKRKGQIQPSYTFIECFVEKHPWHTPLSGSSVCHMAQGPLPTCHVTAAVTLKGCLADELRHPPRPTAPTHPPTSGWTTLWEMQFGSADNSWCVWPSGWNDNKNTSDYARAIKRRKEQRPKEMQVPQQLLVYEVFWESNNAAHSL